jgi:superfamily II DNA/RNA helicase
MRYREEGKNLSKITVEPEPGLTDTLLTAELDPTHNAPTFTELGVRPEIVRALGEIGIERTFAIQELTLPLALAGEDLIGQARTGMGKTFGFGVPLLHRISTIDSGTTPLDGTPRALVIVPTRELCIQVTQDLENAGKYLTNRQGALQVASIYGGRPYESQIEALRGGVDVVVGTPGRLLDLAEQQHLILGKVGVLVLDEADEMLDLGFLPDIERILTMVPDSRLHGQGPEEAACVTTQGPRAGGIRFRQTMLFSATMPGPIITLARTFLHRPTHIRAEEPHDSAVHDRTTQFVYRAHALDKSELVARILQAESRGATMIFTRTKRTAQKVADDLADRGFAVGAVHGDLGQVQREKALDKFRKGRIDVLVATDVAARGIDIDDVTHVINYQCPEDEKTYVHRIGRTGRAGRTGVAVTLVDWDELNRWAAIDSALRLGIPEPVETYSRSPHLYSDLGIPEGVTGTLRRKVQRDEDAVVVERESRTPRKRNRRRTRSGQTVDGTENTETTTDPSDDAAESTAAEEDTNGERPARRRRRRRSSGATSNTDAASESSSDDTVSAENSNVSAADSTASADNGTTPSDAADEQPARRRRRRRRPASADTEAPISASA